MRLEISVLCKPGGRAVNEDAYGIRSDTGLCCCVVCDGAGGQGGGDVASKLAVGAILEHFGKTNRCDAGTIALSLAAANTALMEHQGTQPRLARMRSTTVVLIADPSTRQAVWGHLGDSRLYLFRGGRVIAQTKDHSVVQNMVDAGYLTARDLRHASQRSALFAALGQEENYEPAVTPTPTALQPGDVFLLCSDGFWEYIEESAMERSLTSADTAEAWLRSMEAAVLAVAGPGQDNYTALGVWCHAQTASP